MSLPATFLRLTSARAPPCRGREPGGARRGALVALRRATILPAQHATRTITARRPARRRPAFAHNRRGPAWQRRSRTFAFSSPIRACSASSATSTAPGSTPTTAPRSRSTIRRSGEIIGTVPKMGVAETRRAIEAADRAFKGWSRTTAKERAKILRKWFDLMMANQEDLAILMTREQGKPLAESRGEIAYGAAFVEWYAEEGKRVYGDIIPTIADSRRLMVFKQPVGVCAAITPWNFPNAMITRKCAPALAAGCTVVVEARELHAVLGPRAGRARRARRDPQRRVQRGDRRCPHRRRRAHRQRPGAQAVVHRLDRGRQDPAQAVRRHGQEGEHGARRPRAA